MHTATGEEWQLAIWDVTPPGLPGLTVLPHREQMGLTLGPTALGQPPTKPVPVQIGDAERLIELGVPPEVATAVEEMLWWHLDEARAHWLTRGWRHRDLDFLHEYA